MVIFVKLRENQLAHMKPTELAPKSSVALAFRQQLERLVSTAEALIPKLEQSTPKAELVLSLAVKRDKAGNALLGDSSAGMAFDSHLISTIEFCRPQIDELSPPLQKLDDEIEDFCAELRRCMNAVPITSKGPREIRSEIERLPVLARGRGRGLATVPTNKSQPSCRMPERNVIHPIKKVWNPHRPEVGVQPLITSRLGFHQSSVRCV